MRDKRGNVLPPCLQVEQSHDAETFGKLRAFLSWDERTCQTQTHVHRMLNTCTWPTIRAQPANCRSALAQFKVHISNPSLRVSIEFLKRYSNTLPMGVPDIITSHKRSEGYRLRRRKRGVPPGAMLRAGHFLSEFALVGSRNLMPDKLLFGVRMLTFAQSRKVLRLNCAAELPTPGRACPATRYGFC